SGSHASADPYPSAPYPQHRTPPSCINAHAIDLPTATDRAGEPSSTPPCSTGSSSPTEQPSSGYAIPPPQHRTAPSSVTTHACPELHHVALQVPAREMLSCRTTAPNSSVRAGVSSSPNVQPSGVARLQASKKSGPTSAG